MRLLAIGRSIRSVTLGVLACALLGSAGCGGQRSIGPGGPTGELPDQEVSDFALTETDEGHPLWKLYAKYAAMYNVRDAVVARGVRVDFFDDQGKRSSVLTAREGNLNQKTHDMTATGNVELVSTEGTKLSTEELHFLNREQRIVVPIEQKVRVERTGDILTGYGFESDPELRHYELKRQVEATLRPHGGAAPSGKIR